MASLDNQEYLTLAIDVEKSDYDSKYDYSCDKNPFVRNGDVIERKLPYSIKDGVKVLIHKVYLPLRGDDEKFNGTISSKNGYDYVMCTTPFDLLRHFCVEIKAHNGKYLIGGYPCSVKCSFTDSKSKGAYKSLTSKLLVEDGCVFRFRIEMNNIGDQDAK
jgi:hypothetical protein